jgi:hypothetical protein
VAAAVFGLYLYTVVACEAVANILEAEEAVMVVTEELVAVQGGEAKMN